MDSKGEDEVFSSSDKMVKGFLAGLIILDFHRNQENQTSINPGDEPNGWNGPFRLIGCTQNQFL